MDIDLRLLLLQVLENKLAETVEVETMNKRLMEVLYNKFYDYGYSIEFQKHYTGSDIGNYDLSTKGHFLDLTSSETETFYYINDSFGNKLYNFEFTNADELENFILYAMENDVNLSKINESERQSTLHRIIAQDY